MLDIRTFVCFAFLLIFGMRFVIRMENKPVKNYYRIFLVFLFLVFCYSNSWIISIVFEWTFQSCQLLLLHCIALHCLTTALIIFIINLCVLLVLWFARQSGRIMVCFFFLCRFFVLCMRNIYSINLLEFDCVYANGSIRLITIIVRIDFATHWVDFSYESFLFGVFVCVCVCQSIELQINGIAITRSTLFRLI